MYTDIYLVALCDGCIRLTSFVPSKRADWRVVLKNEDLYFLKMS